MAEIIISLPVEVSASLFRDDDGYITPGWAESGCPFLAPPPGRKNIRVRFSVEAVIEQLQVKTGTDHRGLMRDCANKLGEELGRQIELAMNPDSAEAAMAGVHSLKQPNKGTA